VKKQRERAKPVRPIIWLRAKQGGPGPVPGFTRNEIAATAVALADRDGLEAVTMRRLAKALRVVPGALYRYVTSKDELVLLMIDAVAGELRHHVKASPHWRVNLRRAAHAMRATFLAHPWMTTQLGGRATLGPNTLRAAERLLVLTAASGMNALDAMALVDALQAYVRGYVASEIADREAVRRSGLSPDEWWQTQLDYERACFATGKFPKLAEAVARVAAEPVVTRVETGFERGLERLLDGFTPHVVRGK
jgi:AcrR family transcriptional regulator